MTQETSTMQISVLAANGFTVYSQMLEESSTMDKTIGHLMTIPQGTVFTVTLTNNRHPIIFNCDASLNIKDLVSVVNGAKKKRTTA